MVFREPSQDPELKATLDAIQEAKGNPMFRRTPRTRHKGPKGTRKAEHRNLYRRK